MSQAQREDCVLYLGVGCLLSAVGGSLLVLLLGYLTSRYGWGLP